MWFIPYKSPINAIKSPLNPLPWPRESSIHLISMPHMAALAGFVPWAERGMMHTSRWPETRAERWLLDYGMINGLVFLYVFP